jgi:hypothetical protein
MFYSKHAIAAATFSATLHGVIGMEECVSPKTFICHPTTTSPVLDGDLSDWSIYPESSITSSSLTAAMGAMPYGAGDLTMRCVYDESRIYFAFEVPGAYRFDAADDHKCASISTMMPIGKDATYFYMGGCPLAMGEPECNSVPEECETHLVDIGGHWELSTTEMGVEYGVDLESGTGNDPIANKDDEYAVGAYCRLDDNDDLAGNEWAGAWSHTNPTPPLQMVEASPGRSSPDDKYIFEMSRLLKTASTRTDAQLEAGQTIGFGVAFWDPNIFEAGWNAPSHYVTGCSQNWIDLILATDDMDVGGDADEGDVGTSSGSVISALLGLAVIAVSTYASGL